MISVTFTSDVENIVATEHLYQWDNGQKLSISGVGTSADIHFANKKSEKALVVTPTVTSGKMVAPIPNSLLAEPYPIIAYVYVPSDDGSKTIKSVTINIEARKQPSDFVLEDDVGVTTLESISQRANAMIQNATNQVNIAISNMNADYGNFKTTIQSELADMVANTTVPNADTVDGKHASEIMVEKVSDTAELVTLDGLQGGVPFSEIVLGGNIVGQEVTLAVSGKNMLPKPNWDGSVKTSNGVIFSVAGNGTITISGTTTGNSTVHLLSSHINVTEPLTLSSNGTLSGIDLIFKLTKDGEAMYRTVHGKSVIEAGVIIEDIYLQQQKSGVKVSGEISPQLEFGESATAYEPYHGSSVTVTPDSVPYTVPNDIRQQEGVNNVMVSAGMVQVTGVNQNKAFKVIYKRGVPANGGDADTVDGKHAGDFALKTDIPTSLPANGGNANTADTANTANTAKTAKTAKIANIAGTLATTPTNVCLRNISFGTAQPQITNPNADGYVAPGALYAVYE